MIPLFTAPLEEAIWHPGHGPEQVIGECPHAGCPHDQRTPIGRGRDLLRRDYARCDVPDGCAGNCRAWVSDLGVPSSPWLQVVRRIMPG